MRSSLLRSLVLGCSLLLALPPGWCCIFAVQSAKKDAPKANSCCPPCCDKGANPLVPKHVPRPAPRRPDRCPCSDRHTTAPDAPKVIGCDLSCVAPLPATELAPTGLAAGQPVVFRALPTDTSPHLLNCVWLC